MKAKHNRHYPELQPSDTVKVYQKKRLFGKGHVSRWTAAPYRLNSISKFHGIIFYHTTTRARPFLRHELLKVKTYRLII